MRLRLVLAAAVAVASALALPAATLAAGQATVQQVRFEATTQTDLGCGGTPFTDHVVAHFTFVSGADGSLPMQLTVQLDATDTNAAGASLVTFVRNIDRVTSVVQNADGTTTMTDDVAGVPERITTPDGTVVTEDVGLVVFSSTWDAQGTQLSQTVVREAGPHPEADSGRTLFCQLVLRYLG